MSYDDVFNEGFIYGFVKGYIESYMVILIESYGDMAVEEYSNCFNSDFKINNLEDFKSNFDDFLNDDFEEILKITNVELLKLAYIACINNRFTSNLEFVADYLIKHGYRNEFIFEVTGLTLKKIEMIREKIMKLEYFVRRTPSKAIIKTSDLNQFN